MATVASSTIKGIFQPKGLPSSLPSKPKPATTYYIVAGVVCRDQGTALDLKDQSGRRL